MNIFENVVFIRENATYDIGRLTPIEKIKLRSNLKKACMENKKISDFNDSIERICSVSKDRYNEVMNKFGVENVEPFNNPSRITVLIDKSGKEVALYLETPGYVNSIDYKINNKDIQEFIVASIEYKLGIKVFIDQKYLK